MPTELERAVIDTIARLNRPQTRDDAPYPASLLPIAQAVIQVVRGASPAEPVLEARAHDAEADYDRRGERLWRLAALAGYVPCESDNDATAEQAVSDALAGRAKDRARLADAWQAGWEAGCNDQQYGDENAQPWTLNPYADRGCDNYRPPLTCLTAPSSETGRCDQCRAALAPTDRDGGVL